MTENGSFWGWTVLYPSPTEFLLGLPGDLLGLQLKSRLQRVVPLENVAAVKMVWPHWNLFFLFDPTLLRLHPQNLQVYPSLKLAMLEELSPLKILPFPRFHPHVLKSAYGNKWSLEPQHSRIQDVPYSPLWIWSKDVYSKDRCRILRPVAIDS